MADDLSGTPTQHPLTSLTIRFAHGLWLIRSAAAPCWLDLDADVLIRWPPTPGSTPTEVPLVIVQSIEVGDHEIIRVGDRHQYVTDPFPDQLAMSYQTWIQETVTLIAPATEISLDS